LSEVTVEELERARRMIDVVSVQNRYNLTDREHDSVLDYCTQGGIAFIPWLPIANGSHATSVQLAEMAAELDATPAQVSLAWLLHRSPVVVPMPGAKSEAHLTENVAAAQLRLSADQLARLTSMGCRR
jgi:aryl-alcohol dehydrogenase-like predicted oxidoreductase